MMPNTVVHSPNAQAQATSQTPWWKGAVIYQIYPRSFMDSTGNGVGDLAGITAKLDYVADLGVDAVWLSPFFTSPMRDYGYDIADYCDVDPLFGTLADFDALIAKAHSLGLRVIIDQVYSHTSDQHPWFSESRQSRGNAKADWYVWADPKPDGSPPNNWQAVFGEPSWKWDTQRQQYYLHNFLSSQPDLNMHNPAVQEAILNVTRFWLERGVDGFRLDALNFSMHDLELRDNPPATGSALRTRPFDYQEHKYNQSHADIPKFIEKIRGVLDGYTGIFTVAEVGGPAPLSEMKAFTHGQNRLNSAYDFSFLYAQDLRPDRLKAAMADWPGAAGEGWPSWAFSNHDAPRALSRWAKEDDYPKAARLYMLLLLALRGNVFIYQGDELGLPAANVPFDALRDPDAIANWPHTLGRDSARTPMPWTAAPTGGFSTSNDPWLPVDPRHLKLAAAEQVAAPDSMHTFTKRALKVRAQSEALKVGDAEVVYTDSAIFAIERSTGAEQRVLAIFNLESTDAPLPASLIEKIAKGGTPLISANLDSSPLEASGVMPAYSATVLPLD